MLTTTTIFRRVRPEAARVASNGKVLASSFARKIRRAFFKECGDAFFEIVRSAGFDLALVFEFELPAQVVRE